MDVKSPEASATVGTVARSVNARTSGLGGVWAIQPATKDGDLG
jgi:hypothetical protein